MEKDLKKRTKRFAINIIQLVRKLPKNDEGKILGRQLLRSGTSVGANTRAAFRGRSKREFVAKLGIVIEEADECEFWLSMLEDADIYVGQEITALKREADELVSIFVSISRKNKTG